MLTPFVVVPTFFFTCDAIGISTGVVIWSYGLLSILYMVYACIFAKVAAPTKSDSGFLFGTRLKRSAMMWALAGAFLVAFGASSSLPTHAPFIPELRQITMVISGGILGGLFGAFLQDAGWPRGNASTKS